MQTPSGKNVLPIFSKRKRPRQALYAHPGSQDVSSDRQTEGHGTMPTTPYGQQANPNKADYREPRFQQPGRKALAPAASNANRTWNQGNNNSVADKPSHPGMMSVSRQQPPNTSTRNTGPQRGASQQPYRAPQSMRGDGGPPPCKGHRMYTPNPPSRPQMSYQRPQNQTQVGNAQQQSPSPRFSNDQHYGMNQTTHSPCGPRRGIPHTATLSSTGNMPGQIHSSGSGPSPFRVPAAPPTPVRSTQASSAGWEMKDPQSGGSKPDTSMKILTSGIEELRYWTASNDIKGLIFFEVFGTLSSAVCLDEGGVAKKFTIKDGNHTLQCIFYETDRPLGRLTRGHCLRCMGSILPRRGLFRCVSVRPASPAEQKTMRPMVAACDRAVRQRLHATGVEP